MPTRRWLHVALFSTALFVAPVRAETGFGGLVGNQVYVTDMLGRDVRSSDGFRIGTIADLVMDPALGLVVLLAAGAQQGCAGDPMVVPLSRLRLGPNRSLVADMAREQFRNAASDCHRAGDLLGRDVYTSDDTKIGAVENLVVDPTSNRIVAALIEVAEAGPRPGSPYGHVAVPVARLRAGQGRRLVTDLTREQLHNVPSINYRGEQD